MRHKFKKKTIGPEPQLGATRVITRFLFWPLTLDRELRWLERVSILQVYRRLSEHIPETSHFRYYDDWRDLHWADPRTNDQ